MMDMNFELPTVSAVYLIFTKINIILTQKKKIKNQYIVIIHDNNIINVLKFYNLNPNKLFKHYKMYGFNVYLILTKRKIIITLKFYFH